MASKKKQPVESVHDRDRIIIRLPDGLRDKLAAFAESNGRSMTAEVVAAIEEHLRGATRLAELWDFFERHRQNIEDIPFVKMSVENLELRALITSAFIRDAGVDEAKLLELLRNSSVEETRKYEITSGALRDIWEKRR